MKNNIFAIFVLCGILSAADCIKNKNGTVSCNDTGFMWQDNHSIGTSATRLNFKDAINYCKNLTLGGYKDWRLPNIIELKSITDRKNKIDPSLKDGFTQKNTDWFWSSTTFLPNTSNAWGIYFGDGFDVWSDKADTLYVRCVR